MAADANEGNVNTLFFLGYYLFCYILDQTNINLKPTIPYGKTYPCGMWIMPQRREGRNQAGHPGGASPWWNGNEPLPRVTAGGRREGRGGDPGTKGVTDSSA